VYPATVLDQYFFDRDRLTVERDRELLDLERAGARCWGHL